MGWDASSRSASGSRRWWGRCSSPPGLAQAVEVPPDCAVPPFVDLTQYNVIIGTDDVRGHHRHAGRRLHLWAAGGRHDQIAGRRGPGPRRQHRPSSATSDAAGGRGHDRRRCRRRRGPAGATGDDVVNGGSGDDFLALAVGNDVAQGGHGDDFANGGFGRDTMIGGPGADALAGGFHDDLVNGGPGDDLLVGEIPADSPPPASGRRGAGAGHERPVRRGCGRRHGVRLRPRDGGGGHTLT